MKFITLTIATTMQSYKRDLHIHPSAIAAFHKSNSGNLTHVYFHNNIESAFDVLETPEQIQQLIDDACKNK